MSPWGLSATETARGFGIACTNRLHIAAVAVAFYIGAAYWLISFTPFANPAVTNGRIFTAIAPGSLPGFIAAQLNGMVVGLGLVTVVVPAPKVASAAA